MWEGPDGTSGAFPGAGGPEPPSDASHSAAAPSYSSPHSSLAPRACYFLLGAGLLAAWNALITATDYFQAVYPGWHTDRLFTLCYLPVCMGVLLLTLRYPDLLSAPARIRVGYLGFTAAMAAVPLLDALMMAPASSAAPADPSSGALAAVLLCVAAVGACDGLCQGALFAEAAQLPPAYTHALVSGTASSGLLVCLLRIASKASFEAAAGGGGAGQDQDQGAAERQREGLRNGTRLYFALGGLLSLSCLLLYDLVLPRLRTSPWKRKKDCERRPLLPPPRPPLELELSVGSRSGSGPGSPGGSGRGGKAAVEAVAVAGGDARGQLIRSTPGCGGGSGGTWTGDGERGGSDGGSSELRRGGEWGLPGPTASGGLGVCTSGLGPAAITANATVAGGSVAAAPSGASATGIREAGSGSGSGSPGEGAAASSWGFDPRGGAPHASYHPSSSVFTAPATPAAPLSSAISGFSTSPSPPSSWLATWGSRSLGPQAWRCLALCWPLCGSLAVTYTVTLSIFPGFLAEDVHSAELGDWYPILLITAFNAADLVGKSLPCLQPDTPPPPPPAPSPPVSASPSHLPAFISTQHQNHHRNDHNRHNHHNLAVPLLSPASHRSAGPSGEGGSPTLDPLGRRHPPAPRGRWHVLTSSPLLSYSKAALAALVAPLRRPRGLLAAAVVRGLVSVPAFVVADLWGLPAVGMALLTALLGVTNGYLTSQVLTMGPTSVLPIPSVLAPGVGQQADSCTTPHTRITTGREALPGYQAQSGELAAPQPAGLMDGWSDGAVVHGLSDGSGGLVTHGSAQADAEVVETLLVVSLVGGLNLGAYLGWLWLL